MFSPDCLFLQGGGTLGHTQELPPGTSPAWRGRAGTRDMRVTHVQDLSRGRERASGAPGAMALSFHSSSIGTFPETKTAIPSLSEAIGYGAFTTAG